MNALKIERVDREGMKTLRLCLEKVAEEVAEQTGLAVKVGRGSFNPDGSNGTFTLEFAVRGADGVAETREVAAWKQLAATYGLKPEWLGKTFKHVAGGAYRVTGLNTWAPKFPVQAVRTTDGKTFKFPVQALKVATWAD